MKDEIVEFINKRFKDKDCDWMNGNCYYFALILHDRFPETKIVYDTLEGHFLILDNDTSNLFPLYDYKGKHMINSHHLIVWDKFDEYDPLLKKRIERDCLL